MSNGGMKLAWLLLAVAATVAATAAAAPTEATIAATVGSVDGCPANCDCAYDDLDRYLCGGLEVKLRSDGCMEIVCHESTFNCSLIPRLTFGGGEPLQRVEVTKCSLPPDAEISCATRAVGAGGTHYLTIQEGDTAPTEANVRGLDVDRVFWKFKYRKVNTIPIAALSALPHVRKVTLQSLWSTSFHGGMFSTLPPTVQYLEVSMSAITHIPRDTFLGMQNLTMLSLWGNNIERIDEGAFNGLTSLQKLVLNNNPLVSLPPGVLRASPLQHLYLERVSLAHLLEGTFQGLHELKEIKILVNVKSGLTLGARTFANLPSLTSVHLTYSKLSTLPDDLFSNSTSLSDITFENNNITSLPSRIFTNQSQLRILNFRKNRIEDISPEIFNYLAALESLDLSWNNMTELPRRAFNGVPNLMHLNLSHNNIRHVTDTTFRGARALLLLDLSHNQLAWTPSDAADSSSPFNSLNMLQTLNLSYNRISTVFSDWRYVLPLHKLTRLDLQYNAFSQLSHSDIHFFGSSNKSIILQVDLRHNNITDVKTISVLQPDPNVVLKLESSSYHCNCNMYYLRVQAQLNNFTYQLGESSCELPANLATQKVEDISLEEFTCESDGAVDEACRCIHRPLFNRTECDCDRYNGSTMLPDLPAIGYPPNMSLRILNTPLSLNSTPSFVKELKLTGLNLTDVPIISKHVESLDLTDNRLSLLPDWLIDNNISMRLSGNPILCECATTTRIEKLKKHGRIDDLKDVYCYERGLLDETDPASLCNKYYSILYGVTTCTVLISFCAAVALLCRYRIPLEIWMFSRGWLCCVRREKQDPGKTNDIYVSYIPRDELIVYKEMLPMLEVGTGRVPFAYKLFLPDKDFIPGRTVAPQITAAVRLSRRVLVVGTREYFLSAAGRETLRAVHHQARLDRRLRAVVLLLNLTTNHLDEETRTHLSLAEVIPYDSSKWDQILYFLPRIPMSTPIRNLDMYKPCVSNGKSRNTICNIIASQNDKSHVFDNSLYDAEK